MLALVLTNASLAQDSVLAGRITAYDLAPVPIAVVTVIQLDTGWKRAVLSDGRGSFVLHGLPPGEYRVEAVKPGFKPAVESMITVKPGENPSLDLHLVPASPSEIAYLPVFWP